MNAPELITVGHIIKEYIRFPEKEIGPVLGSPAAYSAVTASRLGMKTGVVTRIGKDMEPSLIQPLLDAGVDTRGINTKGESSRTTILTYDISGNKTAHYEKTAPEVTVKDIPLEYLSAKAALICPMDFEVPLVTSEALFNHGLLLMVDLGGFGGTVSTNHPRSMEHKDHTFLRELANYCSIIKASVEDCQYLFGSARSAESFGRFLVDIGTRIAIVTSGEEGSLVFIGEDYFSVPAFLTNVTDTTGAGDAYCAGFIVEYLRTRDVTKAAIFASATASIMIEESGGVIASRMPTTSQVRERIAGTSLSPT